MNNMMMVDHYKLGARMSGPMAYKKLPSLKIQNKGIFCGLK
jgi:hypothetical protein